jgi:hypothetical protein
LRKALNVQSVNGWDKDQCRVARAISRHPDKQSRLAHDPTFSTIQVSLVDCDTLDAQGIIRHQTLAGAAVITGRYEERDLVMMYTVGYGYETFNSLEQLGASLPARLDKLPPDKICNGNCLNRRAIFSTTWQALIANQLDSIAAITAQGLAAELDTPLASAPQVENANIQEQNALIELADAIPDWLFGASVTDLDHYSQSINALGKLYRQTDKQLFRIPPMTTFAQQRAKRWLTNHPQPDCRSIASRSPSPTASSQVV